MINFEEELKKFKTSLEIEEVESAIDEYDTRDMADIISDMLQELKKQED